MAAQLELALDNLDAILSAVDMTFANIIRPNAYTTDADQLFKHFPARERRPDPSHARDRR